MEDSGQAQALLAGTPSPCLSSEPHRFWKDEASATVLGALQRVKTPRGSVGTCLGQEGTPSSSTHLFQQEGGCKPGRGRQSSGGGGGGSWTRALQGGRDGWICCGGLSGRGKGCPPHSPSPGWPHSFPEARGSWRGARRVLGAGRQLGPFLACLMLARPSRNGAVWIPALGEGAAAPAACGESRTGILALHGTWPLPQASPHRATGLLPRS